MSRDKLMSRCRFRDWLHEHNSKRIRLEAFEAWIALQIARSQNTPDSLKDG